SIGCRLPSPSAKNVAPRSGLTFGWSCISRLHPLEPSHKKAQKAQITALAFVSFCAFCAFLWPIFLDFDIRNCNRIQTLQQIDNLSMIELRIVRFNREKESIA